MTRTLGSLVALLLACTSSEQQQADPRQADPTPVRRHKAPDFPPVLADSEDCGRCGRGSHGECEIIRRGACENGPVEVAEYCEYRVPCDESCCNRFPLLGGVALVRPGKPLYSNDWPDPRIEVARVPRDSAGLLVRVAELEDPDDERPLIRVKTLAVAPPAECKGALDDLHGVVLWAAVERKHLQRPAKACAQAVYALGDPEDKEPSYDERRAEKFEPVPFGAARVKAWTWLEYPTNPDDGVGAHAGTLTEHLLLPVHALEREGNGVCYRLSGVLGPRVCSDPDDMHNAPSAD